tara:strand:+ start:529 stop:792 length:264 start_codon:yes stop_codon:yes gene_type:complete
MTGSSRSLVMGLGSAIEAVSVSSVSTQPVCKGVYIGTFGDYYFEINGTAVLFQGTEAGTVLPIKATKVANDSGLSSAVTAGDIVFLY